MDQVVDTETAKEFMKEILDQIEPDELVSICGAVEIKSSKFRTRFSEDNISTLGEEELEDALKNIFSARRKIKPMIERYGLDQLKEWIHALLYGKEEVHVRFESFVSNIDSVPDSIRCDLAGELLHFSQPEKYWLWTRWMWDPKARTGSLPLVTTAAYDLSGETVGEIYIKVGKALAFVHQVGDAAGFQNISKNMFGTDVFLSCVYVVYAYTVLKMRMTQEFNKVMPGLPEFSRRLLGVYKRAPDKGALEGA